MRLTQYDPLAFNKLPTISQAGQDFDAINGDDLISTEFRELFQRHKMDRKFGLCLLHNHFPLEEHERLVEYRGTCVPWKLGKMTRTLQPSAWMISPDDAIQPYEFHFEPTGAEPDLQNPSVQAFLDELTSYLNKHSVRRLFGLCTYPGDDFKGRLEITEGRANINLQPGDYPADEMGFRTAAWFFSPPLWNAKCNCLCKYEGASHSGEHSGHRESSRP